MNRETSFSSNTIARDLSSTPQYAQLPLPLPDEDTLWDTTPSPTMNTPIFLPTEDMFWQTTPSPMMNNDSKLDSDSNETLTVCFKPD